MSHVLEKGEEMGSGAQMQKVALPRSIIRSEGQLQSRCKDVVLGAGKRSFLFTSIFSMNVES